MFCNIKSIPIFLMEKIGSDERSKTWHSFVRMRKSIMNRLMAQHWSLPCFDCFTGAMQTEVALQRIRVRFDGSEFRDERRSFS